jgi:hypothetical protein
VSAYLNQIRIYEDRRERPIRVPSDRYAELQRDVFVKHRVELDPESVMKGGQFSYLELCTRALDESPIPAGTEVVLLTSCSTEFDPKYPSVGSSFMASFGRYDLHAILNEGILGGFTALDLARKIAMHQQRQVFIIALDQNSNPLPKNYKGFVPTENIVGQIDLRLGVKAGALHILESTVVHEARLAERLDGLVKLHGLTSNNVELNFQRGNETDQYLGQELKNCKKVLHSYAASSAQFIQCLHHMTEAVRSAPFSLLLLGDVFSQNYGLMLLKEGDQ